MRLSVTRELLIEAMAEALLLYGIPDSDTGAMAALCHLGFNRMDAALLAHDARERARYDGHQAMVAEEMSRP
jgi:hypothetical protein